MSFGGALFQFSTFWFLAEYFAAGPEESARYGFIAGAICVLAFWFSTQWSVVSMGGKDAVSTHMQRTLAAAEMQGLHLYRRAATEANLGSQLQTLSQNFTDLARRESGGAFSVCEARAMSWRRCGKRASCCRPRRICLLRSTRNRARTMTALAS